MKVIARCTFVVINRSETGISFNLREFKNPKFCGGKGIRTPDLLIANQPLYQLSYAPAMACKLARRRDCSSKRKRPPQAAGGVIGKGGNRREAMRPWRSRHTNC